MLRLLGLDVCGVCVLLTGCGFTPGARVGWEFRVHRPAVSFAPVLVDQEAGRVGVLPLRGGADAPEQEITYSPRAPRGRPSPSPQAPPWRSVPAAPSCQPPELLAVLDDIGRRLYNLERTQGKAERIPPPRPGACPE